MPVQRDPRHVAAYRYLLVVAVGGAVLVVAAAAAAGTDLRWGWMAVLTACLALSYVAPVRIELAEEITTEQATAVFAVPVLALLSWPEAVLVAGVSGAAGYVLRATPLATVRGVVRDPVKVAFSGAAEAIGAGVGAVVVLASGGDGTSLGWVVGVAALGGLVWEYVTRLLVAGFLAVATARTLGEAVRAQWRYRLVGVVGSAWLGAVLAAAAIAVSWGWVLVIGVVVALVPVSRVLIPVMVEGARLPQLFAAAEEIQAARDLEEVEATVCAAARRVLFCDEARTQRDPPATDEIGAPIAYPGAEVRWLVCGRRRGTYGEFPAQERSLLQALAAIAAPALESAALTERLREQALRDPLTGLHNRRSFAEQFAIAAARAERSGEHLGLLFVDLDRFKLVNDRYGHDRGDEVLVEVARRLESATRAGDVCGRQGGDEFLVLLAGVSGRGSVAEVASKLDEELEITVGEPSDGVVVGATIGTALYPDDGETLDELLRIADASMYTAKRR